MLSMTVLLLSFLGVPSHAYFSYYTAQRFTDFTLCMLTDRGVIANLLRYDEHTALYNCSASRDCWYCEFLDDQIITFGTGCNDTIAVPVSVVLEQAHGPYSVLFDDMPPFIYYGREFGIFVMDVFMFYPVLVLFFLSVLPYATLILEMCVSVLFVIYGVYSGAYLAMGIFATTLIIHSIVVLRQLLWLCLAWRYRCTLHASFISADGKVYPVDPGLPIAASGNRLLVPGRPTIDYAVAYGSKVNLVRLGAAEVWEP
uniref:Large envelope glycoprotein n=1 Tax=Equine arteritis virus TaxID=11047 RepID=A1E2Y6_EAV|nr:large envelope glycoprotein [Equine arteritis virus]